jgi:hypothetical protein
MTEQMIKDQILTEVGEGRLSYDEALQELEEGNITASPGYFKSLLAFSASAILVGAGFNRNGF